jgi:hypothetical protein
MLSARLIIVCFVQFTDHARPKSDIGAIYAYLALAQVVGSSSLPATRNAAPPIGEDSRPASSVWSV